MNWLGWGVLLFFQNFSFTIVSRARNSDSILFHGIAATFSNGIWILSQIIIIGSVAQAINDGHGLAKIALFYSVVTAVGSLSSHWLSMRFLETMFKKQRQ